MRVWPSWRRKAVDVESPTEKILVDDAFAVAPCSAASSGVVRKPEVCGIVGNILPSLYTLAVEEAVAAAEEEEELDKRPLSCQKVSPSRA